MSGTPSGTTPSLTRVRAFLELVVLALTGAVCVGLLVSMYQSPRPVSDPTAVRAAGAVRPPRPQVPIPAEPITLEGVLMGSRTAPVAVIEYSDFQCPFCGRFARETFPTFVKKYIDTGKVLFGFRHLPLEQIHQYAVKAAEAAECAGRQGKFWPMADALFSDQTALADVDLRRKAHTLRLDEATFDRCLGGEASEKVLADAASARALALNGTPTFLVGRLQPDGRLKVGRVLASALTISQFEAAVEGYLKVDPSKPTR